MAALRRALLLILIIGIPLAAYVPRRILTSSGLAFEKWADSSFPIVWRLNPSKGSNITGTRDPADLVRQGFQAWSAVPTARVSFSEGSATAITNAAFDQMNLISFAPANFNSDAAALTIVYSFAQTGTDLFGRRIEFPGQILEADIVFNPAAPFSTDINPGTGQLDLQSRITHEIGHLLGLDHSGLASAVMFPAQVAGTTHLRTLSTDDLIGISSLYPASLFSSLRGGLRGVVHTPSGSPVFGAHVVIFNAAGQAVVSTITDPDGVYQVSGLEPGSYSAYAEPMDSPLTPAAVPTLGVIYPNKTPADPFTTRFAASSGAPAAISLTKTGGENQTGNIGEPLAAVFEVEVRDAGGNPMAGSAVTFAAVSGGGTVVPLIATTDAQGKARTTGYLGTGLTQAFAASASSSVVTFTAILRAPILTSVTNNSGVPATSIQVTLAGSNFLRGATAAAVSGTGVTVSSLNVTNPNAATATITISTDASPGAREVRVTTAAGISAPALFTVAAATLANISFLNPASNAAIRELTVNEGNSMQVKLRILDTAGASRDDVKVTYTSINPDVATADTAGNIQGKKAGFSTLTVAAGGIVSTATVTVVQIQGAVTSAEVTGVAQDSANRLYLASSQDHTIRIAQAVGQTPVVYAGIPQTPGFNDAVRLQALFKNPAFLALNQADGKLYVSDAANNRIRVVTTGASGRAETLAGTGSAGSQNGAVQTATFANPQGVALDNAGNLWVADSGNHTIRRINLVTRTVETVAGLSGSPGAADGAGDGARFNAPAGIALEPETVPQQLERFFKGSAPPAVSVIVADSGNGLIRRVKANGQVETLATGSTTGLTVAPGIGSSKFQTGILEASNAPSPVAVQLNAAVGVAVDPTGNIFVTQPSLGSVSVILRSGDVVPAAQPNTFRKPQGLVISKAGKVVVADGDRSAQEIRFGEPAITSAPARISNAGGERIVIEGNNFAPDSIVVVGGALAANVTVENTQRISLTTPAMPSGLTNLTVQNRGGLTQREIFAEPAPLSTLAAGRITTVAGGSTFAGDGAAAKSSTVRTPFGIAVDSIGNLYIADTGSHRIREISAATEIITTVAGTGQQGFSGDNGLSTAAALYSPQGIAVDQAGNIYIAEFGNHRIRKVTAATGVISTFAGNGQAGFSGDNGLATAAAINTPFGLAIDAAGDLFICDAGNNRIRKVTAATGVITTVAGTGQTSFSGDNGPATAAAIAAPFGITFDAAGNLFFSDFGNRRVRKIASGSGIITTVAGNGQKGFSGDGGPAIAAVFASPMGVAVDESGNLLITDAENDRVRKFAADTGIITTIAGNGQRGVSGDDGPATAAALVLPFGVTVDPAGNIWITIAGRVRKVAAASGIITTAAGAGGGNLGDGGPAAAASLAFPSSVVTDTAGNLMIADSFNSRVRKVAAGTGVITTVAGGNFGFSGDNGPATSAAFSEPFAVTLDAEGNLFIADSNPWVPSMSNNRIRKVANGTVTTVAGNGQTGFSGNGLATATPVYMPLGVTVDLAGNIYIAESGWNRIRGVDAATGILVTVVDIGLLNGPMGLVLDAAGNLLIADTGNNRILKVWAGTGGLITVVAGAGQAGFSGDNGLATAAKISGPVGIALDSAGNLFIADTNNNRVRKVSAATGIITTVAGNGQAGFSGDNIPASSATLSMPYAVAVDANGNLYIADTTNHRIRAVRGPN